MRKKKVRCLSLPLALAAACHVNALLGTAGGGGGGGGGGGSGVESLVQLRSDGTTVIPTGGSIPEASMVMRAVVRDSAGGAVRLEVEVQPVGTAFAGQATGRSAATPSGMSASVPVSGLQDSTDYHWQARAEGAPTWQPYGGNSENAADVRVATPVATTRLKFTQAPTTTAAGATMAPVRVAVVDANGNTITTYTGAVSVTLVNANGAVLGGNPSDAPLQSGVATFSNLSITQAGSGYQLEATSAGLAAVPSPPFAITPGSPDHLVFLQDPSNVRVNQAITPAVRVAVHDVYSNVVTSFTDVMFMNIGTNGAPLQNGNLDPAGTHRAASAGIATFEDLRIDQVGVGYTLAVSAAGTRGATSGRFDVAP
ncbi:MAG TPA: hypothetical protein VEO58_00200 [Gemmatimonadales bacterium]|jgi:hypothetical protein|nr:hypothetical protein [Gemmatimonadales bacterium]